MKTAHEQKPIKKKPKISLNIEIKCLNLTGYVISTGFFSPEVHNKGS